MNEATDDNNGAYLSDGRHGNGCRQRERERERGDCGCAQRWIVSLQVSATPIPPRLALVKRY